MADARIAQKGTFATDVDGGKSYFWCRCGCSDNQPFCDGSHKRTGFAPLPYKAETSRKIYFSGCKHSGKAPLCDGTHSSL